MNLPTYAQREPRWLFFDHQHGCVWVGDLGKRGVGFRFAGEGTYLVADPALAGEDASDPDAEPAAVAGQSGMPEKPKET